VRLKVDVILVFVYITGYPYTADIFHKPISLYKRTGICILYINDFNQGIMLIIDKKN